MATNSPFIHDPSGKLGGVVGAELVLYYAAHTCEHNSKRIQHPIKLRWYKCKICGKQWG